MSWEDKILLRGSYRPPNSSDHLPFNYENLSYNVTKKTAAFQFAEVDGTFVQDLGHTGRKFPMRLFFWGEDYHLEVETFEKALMERGAGILEHPMYGLIDVVPFGEIKRRDDLKDAANQAVMEVTFWETTSIAVTAPVLDLKNDALTALSEFNDAAASLFDKATSLESAVEKASFKNRFDTLIKKGKEGLQEIADVQNSVQRQFDAVSDSITQGIDLLVGAPLTLAAQTLIMFQAPARALASIRARLSAYKDLANDLFTGSGGPAIPGVDSSASNTFHSEELAQSAIVAASALATLSGDFKTRPEAIAAAGEIIEQFNTLGAWRDANYQSLGEVDSSDAYAALLAMVAVTAGFLVQISFDLDTEITISLDKNRSVIGLVAELYGTVDDKLDFFISTNGLTGSEILELPMGRKIVYYT